MRIVGKLKYIHVKPSNRKIDRLSKGLALEQFFVLLEFQGRTDPGRPHPLSWKHGEKKAKLSVPSKKHEGAATRKFKTASKDGPPAEGVATRKLQSVAKSAPPDVRICRWAGFYTLAVLPVTKCSRSKIKPTTRAM